MKWFTRLKVGHVVVLVLLFLLTCMVLQRRGVTGNEAAGEAVVVADKIEHTVVRNRPEVVVFLALVALFAFVTWTVLRAKMGEDKEMPPPRESSASDKTAFR
jgi:hypothetical protein